METTLILIKPDGVQRRLVGRILARFEENPKAAAFLRQESKAPPADCFTWITVLENGAEPR